MALAIRIETGSRTGSAAARRGTRATAARESITGSHAGSNGIGCESCCSGFARRAYCKPACRDTRASSFNTSGESNSYTRAGYSGCEASGKGVGYSALAESKIGRIAGHQVVRMCPVGKRFHPPEPSADIFMFGSDVEAELFRRIVEISTK